MCRADLPFPTLMNTAPTPTPANRPRLSPARFVLRFVQNLLLPALLLLATAVFLVLFFQKEPFRTPAGDAAIILGLLAAVGTVFSLHPEVRARVQQWMLHRAEEKERRFWQGRDYQDARQAAAQEKAAAERMERERLRDQQSETPPLPLEDTK